jgi:hypothetical protein
MKILTGLQCPLLFIFSVSIGEETEWWKVYEWMRFNTLDFQLLALKAGATERSLEGFP